MQKPILPIQISGASPSAPRAKTGPADGGAQFNQTLTREIEHRNKPPQPAQANKQNGPAKPQQQANSHTDKAGAPKKTGNEPARVVKDKAVAKETAAADSAAQAAATAAGQNPVVDMMALVASFNQPAAAAADADPLLSGGGSTQIMDGKFAAAAATAGMDKLATVGAALLTGATDGGAQDVIPGVFNTLMAKQLGNARDGVKGAGVDNANPMGLQQAALGKDNAAGQAPELAQGKAIPDPGQFADLRARAATTPVADPRLKDIQVTAPAAAPVQQASLAMANAANGVGAGDKIPARVGTPGWDNQVAQKIVWMVAGKEQSATLTLNPPDMGPMQVVLSVTNDHASVTFSSATPEVRQALEDAMPKLREMMSESGIALGNASVNDGAAQRQQQAQEDAGGRPGRGDGRGVASGSAAEAEAKQAERPKRGGELPGLVDTFA